MRYGKGIGNGYCSNIPQCGNGVGYGCPQVPPIGENMYYMSNNFDGVRNTPQLIACLEVSGQAKSSVVSVTVNYMAIPEGTMGTPIATFVVTFDNGCGENELRRYSQTATGYCTPQLATFSFAENVGAGVYRVYAVLEECFMNTPQNQATVDLYVIQPNIL